MRREPFAELLGDERRGAYAHARIADRFEHREAATREPRALAGGEPNVAPIALFGDPYAAFHAFDFEPVLRFEAKDLAFPQIELEAFALELHRAQWAIADP